MISLNNWATQAHEKLKAEAKAVSGQREKVMAGPVMEAIKGFCVQDEEFAQAVVQGGTFSDCMKAVAAGVGNAISDIDAYKKAVQFYFPGAEIKVQMSIDLIGDAALPATEEKKEQTGPVILDLMSFF
jgi:hypothetical protein